MKLSMTCFKNFVWPSNPEKIQIRNGAAFQQSPLPGGGEYVAPVNKHSSVIELTGVFFGANAYGDMCRLEALLKDNSPGELYLPELIPMKAYFVSLDIQGEAKKEWVKYAAVFLQSDCDSRVQNAASDNAVTALEGENLFDIAYRGGTTAEKLMALNCFKTPFDISAGKEVKIK